MQEVYNKFNTRMGRLIIYPNVSQRKLNNKRIASLMCIDHTAIGELMTKIEFLGNG